MSRDTLEACPKCGSDEGYYTKETASGTIRYRYNYDGSEAENGDMYDGLSYKGGKWAYCLSCDKRLFEMQK
jgi:hypothetical protein